MRRVCLPNYAGAAWPIQPGESENEASNASTAVSRIKLKFPRRAFLPRLARSNMLIFLPMLLNFTSTPPQQTERAIISLVFSQVLKIFGIRCKNHPLSLYHRASCSCKFPAMTPWRKGAIKSPSAGALLLLDSRCSKILQQFSCTHSHTYTLPSL